MKKKMSALFLVLSLTIASMPSSLADDSASIDKGKSDVAVKKEKVSKLKSDVKDASKSGEVKEMSKSNDKMDELKK